jgi:hypothetical protein
MSTRGLWAGSLAILLSSAVSIEVAKLVGFAAMIWVPAVIVAGTVMVRHLRRSQAGQAEKTGTATVIFANLILSAGAMMLETGLIS